MDIISLNEEVYDYDFWFNQIELHGDVHNYGPDYVHNKILQQIIFMLDLPTGKIVMLGSNKCYGLELFGNETINIDTKNDIDFLKYKINR